MKHGKCRFAALLLSAGLLVSGCGAAAPENGSSGTSPAESLVSGTESALSTGSKSAAESGENVMDKKLREVLDSLQGRWVDVNGDSVLEISGSRMKRSYRTWLENYNIVVRLDRNQYVLENREGGGDFGILSALDIDGDELRGYEQILDGDSHTYRFVREEKKAELLKIEDLSKDLPKTIESRDIEEFTLVFNYDAHSKYGLDLPQT